MAGQPAQEQRAVQNLRRGLGRPQHSHELGALPAGKGIRVLAVPFVSTRWLFMLRQASVNGVESPSVCGHIPLQSGRWGAYGAGGGAAGGGKGGDGGGGGGNAGGGGESGGGFGAPAIWPCTGPQEFCRPSTHRP